MIKRRVPHFDEQFASYLVFISITKHMKSNKKVLSINRFGEMRLTVRRNETR